MRRVGTVRHCETNLSAPSADTGGELPNVAIGSPPLRVDLIVGLLHIGRNSRNAGGRALLVLVSARRSADAEARDDLGSPLDRDSPGKRNDVRGARELGTGPVGIFRDELNELA